ncbi:MAG: hypothetical protein ABSF61_08440 [Anaerolineales bacterium]|jgi:hypothetical protein
MRSPGRYQLSSKEAERKTQESKDLWGGVFALLVGIALAVGGYIGANLMIEANKVQNWVSLPPELAWPPAAPFLAFKLAVGLVAMLIGGALFTVLYGLASPVRPGEHDAPATRLRMPKERR